MGIPANPYRVPDAPRVLPQPEKRDDMYNQFNVSPRMSTDKAVSIPSPSMERESISRHAPTPEIVRLVPTNSGVIGGRRLLDEGDDRWRLLAAVEALVTMMGDNDLAHDLLAVRNMTSARIREQRGTILDYLGNIYDGVSRKFADASASLDGYFAEIEQMLNEMSED